MHVSGLSIALVLVGGVTVDAVPSADDFEFASLLRRQAPGTPQYDCHSECGNVIVGGRTDGYCTDLAWVDEYNACLECALEYDIWKYYGSGVSAAASACGLTAVPSPSGGGPGIFSTIDATAATTIKPAPTTGGPSTETTSPEAPYNGTPSFEAPSTETEISSSVGGTPAPTTSASSTASQATQASHTARPVGSNASSTVVPSAVVTAGATRVELLTSTLIGFGIMMALALKVLESAV